MENKDNDYRSYNDPDELMADAELIIALNELLEKEAAASCKGEDTGKNRPKKRTPHER